MILAALEREWRKHTDERLGQLLVNLLRGNASVPVEDEGHALFNVQDGQLLEWLGPISEAEHAYVREEPRRAREGWLAWQAAVRQSEFHRPSTGGAESDSSTSDPDLSAPVPGARGGAFRLGLDEVLGEELSIRGGGPSYRLVDRSGQPVAVFSTGG